MVADVVCLGESMVTFRPSRPGRLADVPSFERGIGGAESNVACALAAAGHRTRWISRVGTDGFGDHVVEAIAAYGVDVSGVRRDPSRPTGVYFRTAGERVLGDLSGADASEVVYYRAGSAASAMSPALIPASDVWSGRILHLSGITAALSADCLALMRELLVRRDGRPVVSFDVNYRAGLWRSGAADVLAELARGSDIVFVGEDEAEALWGVRGADAVRAFLPEPSVLVVKGGAVGATAFFSPTPPLPETEALPQTPDGLNCAPRSSASDGLGVTGGGGTRRGDAGRKAKQSRVTPERPAPAPDSEGRPNPARPAFEDAPAGRSAAGGNGPALGSAREPTDHVVKVPALHIDVVAPVGAGDAFAAGFLSGTLRGLPLEARVRHGHLAAAAALTVPGDLAVPPERAFADRLVALDDDAWGRLRLGPGWTGRSLSVEEGTAV
ncbi:sugar kinase [Streptomyces blastmyceticus]|uniref:Sugar kinase n=1 Tax=Streptomyces blastmyceticus TaxID=68180 RepID=A0ABN0WF23_9ACTN